MLSFRKKISSEKTLKLLVFFADLNDYTHKIKVDILKHHHPIFIFFYIPIFNVKVDIMAYEYSIHQSRLFLGQHFIYIKSDIIAFEYQIRD